MGRDANDRVIFVPLAIPGEKVRVEIADSKKRFAWARIIDVLEPSTERITPRCPHFGSCGECHFQHIDYESQLVYKTEVVGDQLGRIGGLPEAKVLPTWPNPEPWHYANSVAFSPREDGGFGFWSPVEQQVIPIETCLIIKERLLELFHDLDFSLPGLRKLTLRTGDDDALLAALEIEGMEPPSLETDFPISISLILPDGTAANLVGDNYLVHEIGGHQFRVSAGCYFPTNHLAAEQVVKTVLDFLALTGEENVVELYSGVGMLTAFLAPAADQLVGIEINPDAVADAAVNLHDLDNVTLYEGPVEEILPLLDSEIDMMVVDPPSSGLPPTVIDEIATKRPRRLVTIGYDAAMPARDAKRLTNKGYRLVEVQPIDMWPQSYYVLSISLWALGE